MVGGQECHNSLETKILKSEAKQNAMLFESATPQSKK